MPSDANPTGLRLGRVLSRAEAAASRLNALMDRQIPEQLLLDPETARRARLMSRFGSLGGIFGLTYALFYLVIAHYWGAGIVIVCTTGWCFLPV